MRNKILKASLEFTFYFAALLLLFVVIEAFLGPARKEYILENYALAFLVALFFYAIRPRLK